MAHVMSGAQAETACLYPAKPKTVQRINGFTGVRLENGKYPTLSLFFKQAYAVALMPIQSGPCDRRLIHFMK